MRCKTSRLPHLEFLAQADKGDVGGDAGVLPEPHRQNGASVLIERISLVPNKAVARWSRSSE
jgi:hypothetical protein